MSTALHPVKLDRHLSADPVPSLDDLAATANREHAACEGAAQTALGHAIACGEALLIARKQFGSPTNWRKWAEATLTVTYRATGSYMRLATYRDELDEDMQVNEALRLLAGKPDIAPRGRPAVIPAERREAALRLVADEGLNASEAAREVGVSRATILRWVDPESHKAQSRRDQRRARAARLALREAEREKTIRAAVRKAGAGLAEAYSMAARLNDVLAQAEREAVSDEAREALQDARAHYHRMSDAITRALGVS